MFKNSSIKGFSSGRISLSELKLLIIKKAFLIVIKPFFEKNLYFNKVYNSGDVRL